MNGLMAVIGYPVTHSWSPLLFNDVFRKAGLNSYYLAVSLEPSSLQSFVEHSRESFIGFNVTMPHKVDIIPMLDHLDPSATGAGAVNLVVNWNGKLNGFNSDVTGFLRFVHDENLDFSGKSIVFVGAGGVFRAALHAIRSEFRPEKVTVMVRDPEKYQSRISETGTEITGLKAPADRCDFLINCTPVGMRHYTGSSMIPGDLISSSGVFIDLVYNPPESESVRFARKLGIRSFSGTAMFLYQAEETFERVLGMRPPHDYFRSSMDSIMELSP